MARVIPWSEVAARRLERHGLVSGHPSIAAAATAMCGVHAQIMSAAELSLGLRVDAVTRADVVRALWDDRTVVKTFGPRGTVHLLASDDLAMWTAALAAVPTRPGLPPDVRLDAQQSDAVVGAVADALREHAHTTDELDAVVVRRCGAWAGERTMPAFGGWWPRWRQTIAVAAARGVLCFGPNRGRRTTYTDPRAWVPGLVPLEEGVALRRLVGAYLHAYGPATPAHFAQWLAAPTPWAREQFARCDLDEVDLDGAPAWVNAGDLTFGGDPSGLSLLAYFDAFAVGSHPRGLLFPGRAAERALAGTQAGNLPVLLVDGRVAGVWHLARAGRRIVVTVEPLGRLPAARRRAVAHEAERMGMIDGRHVELVIGPVTVGPHA